MKREMYGAPNCTAAQSARSGQKGSGLEPKGMAVVVGRLVKTLAAKARKAP